MSTRRRRGTRRRRSSNRRRNGQLNVFREIPNTIFRRMVGGTIAFSSSGSGTLFGTIPTDMSTGFLSNTDWTPLAELFGAVRVRGMKVQVTVVNSDEKTTGASAYYCAFNITNTAAPTTVAQVADNPGCRLLSPINTGNGITLRATWPRNMLFAPTSAPNPDATILSGCPGCFAVAATGHTNSIVLLNIRYAVYLEFTQAY